MTRETDTAKDKGVISHIHSEGKNSMKTSIIAFTMLVGFSTSTTAELDAYASPLSDMRREAKMFMSQAGIGMHDVEPRARRKASQVAEAQFRMVIRAMVHAEALRQNVPTNLAVAIAKQESGFNPHAVSYQGARGVMQVMPATARVLGYNGPVSGLHDPETNIRLGIADIKQGMDEGGASWAVRRYHGGPNVRMHGQKNRHYYRTVMASAGLAVAQSAHRMRPDANGWLARGTTSAPWVVVAELREGGGS